MNHEPWGQKEAEWWADTVRKLFDGRTVASISTGPLRIATGGTIRGVQACKQGGSSEWECSFSLNGSVWYLNGSSEVFVDPDRHQPELHVRFLDRRDKEQENIFYPEGGYGKGDVEIQETCDQWYDAGKQWGSKWLNFIAERTVPVAGPYGWNRGERRYRSVVPNERRNLQRRTNGAK